MVTAVVAFERLVRAYVAQGSGLKSELVIPGNQRAPRPKDAYASVLSVTDRRRGYPITRYFADTENTTSLSYRRGDFSVQFYRTGASNRARNFCIWAESEVGLTVSDDYEFKVVFPAGGLNWQRLDDILGDSFEERAIIDLQIDYTHLTGQETGMIDTIECYLDADGEISTGSITT